MQGALAGALCHACAHRWTAPLEMTPQDLCPACAAPATRPDIVWFGEVPYRAEVIDAALAAADLFAAIRTSGNVYPAAAYARHCAPMGAHTLELSLGPSQNTRDFSESHFGPATQVVPDWVSQILKA